VHKLCPLHFIRCHLSWAFDLTPHRISRHRSYYCVITGSSECLKVLVEIGANVNAVDCDGISVLHTALIAGLDVESLQILLEAGADPDHCDDDGESPRMWVSEEGDKDVVDLFALFLTR